jgi:ABC-type dipeptide transport system, periplasmic component
MKKICTSFFLLILLFSCSKKGETPGNYFYYNEISQIKSLDPAYARDLAHMWIVSQMFNTLVELDDSLKIVPSLAKRWDVDPSGKIYTFYLRNDVLFHQTPFHPDKELCSVHDVLFTFQRLANPRTASPGRWVTVPIDTLPDGKLFIEIINDSIIRFHLKKPFTPFLYYLTLPYTSIVPANMSKKMGKILLFGPCTGLFI